MYIYIYIAKVCVYIYTVYITNQLGISLNIKVPRKLCERAGESQSAC